METPKQKPEEISRVLCVMDPTNPSVGKEAQVTFRAMVDHVWDFDRDGEKGPLLILGPNRKLFMRFNFVFSPGTARGQDFCVVQGADDVQLKERAGWEKIGNFLTFPSRDNKTCAQALIRKSRDPQ